MIIQDKNTVTGELSYFEMTLLLYLKESHPHIAGDKALVRARADNTLRQKPARFSGRTSGNHSDTTSKTVSNLEKRKS